jgi:hypothetical protein
MFYQLFTDLFWLFISKNTFLELVIILDLVEVSGLEPLTSALQRQRSTNWAIPPERKPIMIILFQAYWTSHLSFAQMNFAVQSHGLCWTRTSDLTLIRGTL